MIILEGLLKLATHHPALATVGGISVATGLTAIVVTAVHSITTLAGKAIDNGTSFTVSTGAVTISMNQAPTCTSDLPAIEQPAVQ